ncbi:MAG: Uncharacterised protein [Cryomorphaceae bacterium]|nr:MAG: Uncharacterised protein [Cryomorphaceae bacterium]
MNIRKVMVEIDNWIANDLAGTVVGNVATTIHRKEFKTVLFKLLLAHEKVFHFSALPQSEDWWVLHKKEMVRGFLSSFWMFSIGQF